MDIVTPAVSSALKLGFGQLTSRIADEWRQQFSKALKYAEKESGMSREDFEEEISRNPELISLAIRLFYIAGKTGRDSVLLSLGKVLNDARRGACSIDEAAVFLNLIEQLTQSHIQLLEEIERSLSPSNRIYMREALQTTLLPKSIARVCFNDLIRLDFLEQINVSLSSYSISKEQPLAITESGWLLIKVLGSNL